MPEVQNERRWDRNYWLGVSNGVFVNGGEAFFNSSLVLAPFLAALGTSPVIIGLIPAMRVGLHFLPQLLVANRLSHEPLMLKYYRFTSTSRNAAFFIMSLVVLFATGLDPGLVAGVVVAMVAVNAISSGVGGVPFADITAKIVPHSRLGSFWALRNVIGGVLALGCGLVLRRILASDIPFPQNFGYLFLIGTILASIGNASFSLVKEPPGEPGMRRPLVGMLRYIPSLLRSDKVLRKFLSARFLGLAALLAEPFYGIHALTNLGAPESALGLYIIAATAVAIVANFAFRRPSNRGRNVLVLQIGYGCLLLALVLAILVNDWRWFTAVFMLSAAGNAGVGSAAWNLLYAISPARERALYIGLVNSVLALPSLAPILAGVAILVIPLPVLFALGAALAAITLLLALRMGDINHLDQLALKPRGSDEVVEILREAGAVADDSSADDSQAGDTPTRNTATENTPAEGAGAEQTEVVAEDAADETTVGAATEVPGTARDAAPDGEEDPVSEAGTGASEDDERESG